MTTREKILVGLMCLAILYGAFELFWTPTTHKPPGRKTAVSDKDLQKFAAEVAQKLDKEKMTDKEIYRIEKASVKWNKDPFLQDPGPLSDKKPVNALADHGEQPSGMPEDLVYSGYLQLGETKMAVINGMEYTVGESLGLNGLYIKKIGSQRVTIGKLKSKETFQLSLQENLE